MNKILPNYQAWDIDENDYPATADIATRIKFLIGYGILAPSQHNTQPWAFHIDNNSLHVLPDTERALAVGDPQNDGLYLSLGACIENIMTAGKYFGLVSSVSFADTSAALAFQESKPEPDGGLLAAITARHSDKAKYTLKPLPEEIINLPLASAGTVTRKLITDAVILQKISAIHLRAATQIASNLDFVKELVGWMRPNDTTAPDGMPGSVIGNSALKTKLIMALVRRKPQVFAKAAAKDKELMESSSGVAIWTVAQKSPATLIECGIDIQHFWLQLTMRGLSAQPLTASVSTKPYSDEIIADTGLTGFPVFLMRIGYGHLKDVKTPRREPVCN